MSKFNIDFFIFQIKILLLLQDLKDEDIIDDFEFDLNDNDNYNDNYVDIYIKPKKIIEKIKLDFTVTKAGIDE